MKAKAPAYQLDWKYWYSKCFLFNQYLKDLIPSQPSYNIKPMRSSSYFKTQTSLLWLCKLKASPPILTSTVVKTSSITQYRYLQMPQTSHNIWPDPFQSLSGSGSVTFPSNSTPVDFQDQQPMYQMLGSGKVHLCSPSPYQHWACPWNVDSWRNRPERVLSAAGCTAMRKGKDWAGSQILSPNSQIRKLQSLAL